MSKRTKKKENLLKLGLMKKGAGDGVQFHFLKGQQTHKYLTPNDPFYCLAIYRAIDMTTVLGEKVFVFTHNIRRLKKERKDK